MAENFGPQIHARHWMQQTISRRYHLIWLECDKVVLSIQFVLVHGIFAVNCEIRFLKVSLQLIMTFCIYSRNTSNDVVYLEFLRHKQFLLTNWKTDALFLGVSTDYYKYNLHEPFTFDLTYISCIGKLPIYLSFGTTWQVHLICIPSCKGWIN